eukprot:scaffold36129_cov56-Isochrysis_galbana.AAC.1
MGVACVGEEGVFGCGHKGACAWTVVLGRGVCARAFPPPSAGLGTEDRQSHPLDQDGDIPLQAVPPREGERLVAVSLSGSARVASGAGGAAQARQREGDEGVVLGEVDLEAGAVEH